MYNSVEAHRQYTKLDFPNHMYPHVKEQDTMDQETVIHLAVIHAPTCLSQIGEFSF